MVSTLNWILMAQAAAGSDSVTLERLDWIVIIAYFAIIAGVAIYASRGQNTASDFFLGSRNIGWFAIGGSLFASNVGSEHIVGLAGSGANTGLSLAHWELHAWVLLMLGWVFVPYYYRSKVFTMPEFLEKRFSPTARWILSIISLAAYVLTKVSVTVYAGALVFNVLFPDFTMFGLDAFWAGALLTIILTGIYSVFGGLRAVLYTDACQAIILLLGSIFILYSGLSTLGGGNGEIVKGWGKLSEFTATHASQYALWHPLSDKDFPWLAICIASPIIGIWYWCTDQYIVQRTLAAKNLTIARRGTIWGAALKVMPVMIFLIPGLIGAAINAQPGSTFSLPLKASTDAGLITGLGTDGDRVFPTLVIQLLKPGFRGLVIAGLLAALMSSLSSLFNSSAALFTVDIYQKLKKEASEKELVYVGKIATTVVVVCGLIWIPIMKQVAQGGGGLYDYLQNVQSFLAPAITATFLLGIFWGRINAKGAVWGLTVGFILGMGKLTIQTFYGAGKIENPAFLAAIGDYNAYYACGLLFLASAITLIIVSLLTKAPDPQQIEGLTFASINKAEVRASIHPIDIVTTLIVAGMIVTIYLYFSFWTSGLPEFTNLQKASEEVDKTNKYLTQIEKVIDKANNSVKKAQSDLENATKEQKNIEKAQKNLEKVQAAAEKAIAKANEEKATALLYLDMAKANVVVEEAKENVAKAEKALCISKTMATVTVDEAKELVAKAEKALASAGNDAAKAEALSNAKAELFAAEMVVAKEAALDAAKAEQVEAEVKAISLRIEQLTAVIANAQAKENADAKLIEKAKKSLEAAQKDLAEKMNVPASIEDVPAESANETPVPAV